MSYAKANNVLFVADEIQTGFGRTGRRFACDWEGVTPNLYIMGKALGGGVFPISAVAGDREVLDVSSRAPTARRSVVIRSAAPSRSRRWRSPRTSGSQSARMQLGAYFLKRLQEINRRRLRRFAAGGCSLALTLSSSASVL